MTIAWLIGYLVLGAVSSFTLAVYDGTGDVREYDLTDYVFVLLFWPLLFTVVSAIALLRWTHGFFRGFYDLANRIGRKMRKG